MRKMWQIYGLAWVAYGCLISIVLQIDDVTHGHFNLSDALIAFGSTLLSPLLLALIWPLSGYLGRSHAHTRALCEHDECDHSARYRGRENGRRVRPRARG